MIQVLIISSLYSQTQHLRRILLGLSLIHI